MDLRVSWDLALAAMLLSLALCMVIAWVYTLTYQGLSYLRGFAQTLATAGINGFLTGAVPAGYARARAVYDASGGELTTRTQRRRKRTRATGPVSDAERRKRRRSSLKRWA